MTNSSMEPTEVSCTITSRRRFTKVRSGCFTCKRRRVKCDETKPGCRRCQTYGVVCEGYMRNIVANTSAKIRPKPPAMPQSDAQASPYLAPSAQPPFQCEEDARYFQAYLTNTAISLSYSGGDGDVWTRIITQAAYAESCLRDMVIAIGAWNESLEFRRHGSISRAITTQNLALQRYVQAIRATNFGLSKISQNERIRNALIGCLLICCFEGLMGNTSTAITHAKSGCRVMREWIKSYKGRKYKSGLCSPASSIVEDELVRAYTRLDEQVTSFRGGKQGAEHEDIIRETEDTIADMPSTFHSENEARAYLELIEQRVTHFCCLVAGGFLFNESQVALAPSDELLGLSMGEVESQKLRNNFLSDTRRWANSFESFINSKAGSASWTSARALLIRGKIVEITVVNALSKTIDNYNNDMPTFQSIVNICEQLIDTTRRHRQCTDFKFEPWTIRPLHTVSRWCPDVGLRRRAIDLLRSYTSTDGEPMREGFWKSSMIAQCNQELSELLEISKPGKEPKQFKSHISEFNFDQRRGAIQVKLVREDIQNGARFETNWVIVVGVCDKLNQTDTVESSRESSVTGQSLPSIPASHEPWEKHMQITGVYGTDDTENPYPVLGYYPLVLPLPESDKVSIPDPWII